VCHLDQRHSGGIEALCDGAHLFKRYLVPLRVHAVSQRHIVD
jgi:hypothetical protein